MLHTKYQSSRHWGFRERFLKFSSWKSIFSLCDLDMQWTAIIWTIFKQGHIRMIPTKFGLNPASCLGGDVLYANLIRQKKQNPPGGVASSLRQTSETGGQNSIYFGRNDHCLRIHKISIRIRSVKNMAVRGNGQFSLCTYVRIFKHLHLWSKWLGRKGY